MKKKLVILSSLFLILDQLVKFIIGNTLILNKEYMIINNIFYLSYTKNTGGAFSILENNQILLIIISISFLLYFFSFIKKKNTLTKLETITFSLIFGGVIGNLIDRLIYGYVVDYIGFILIKYYYPIFNIADICIVVGVILLIYLEFRSGKDANRSNRK